ncbi:hypothetical protein WN55_10478 [Dufourea novaeangliae]|uniref:Uncharacterized protein n=1 Tax=Dufourea novaeangliae TaxID=178035 RepID=A0A154P3Z1_DUFNO|nr:hypothetical protein WN55_10478 [Dufourea novaeangliae]
MDAKRNRENSTADGGERFFDEIGIVPTNPFFLCLSRRSTHTFGKGSQMKKKGRDGEKVARERRGGA